MPTKTKMSDILYTRTISQTDLNNFLSICKQLDDLTDQMSSHPRFRQIMLQIQQLRSQRDAIAIANPFKTV